MIAGASLVDRQTERVEFRRCNGCFEDAAIGGDMSAKNRKKHDKEWQAFQELHRISDEAAALIRRVHGRVSELLQCFPEPAPEDVDAWVRERHREWILKWESAKTATDSGPTPTAEATPKKPKSKAKAKKPAHDPLWVKAKEVCRLNMQDIEMAKQLGMSPKALMKNVPASTQLWKAPVKEWIRDLFEKRFGRASEATASRAKSSKAAAIEPVPFELSDDVENEVPF